MEKITLEDIRLKVEDLAAKINAPEDILPTYGYSRDFAYPHIEVDKWERLHYVIIERGQELDHRITNELDKLLYWIFDSVTSDMASEFELQNRIEDQDCRRIMFTKQEELLGILSDTWRQKNHAEHQRILTQHPFDDLAGLRATYCAELRDQGHTEMEIEKLAYAKYPGN